MRTIIWLPLLAAVVLFFASTGLLTDEQAPVAADDGPFTAEFYVAKDELSPTGRNPYFILEPGYELTLEDGEERVVIAVRDETKAIGGVETRVVEERETVRGRLAEMSLKYLAISKRTGDVFYFGENVDMYDITEGGKLLNHHGTWRDGIQGARFGLMMPGLAVVNAKYYQKISPGIAMDRFEIVSTSETVTTPAGEFKGCLKVKETSPLEPGAIVFKYYAPDIGLVQSESSKLVTYGKGTASTE